MENRIRGNAMIKLRTVLSLAFALLLAGCLPVTSKTPVGTTSGLGTDPALIGTWHGSNENKDGHVYLHVTANGEQPFTLVLVSAEGKDDPMLLQAKTAQLGQNRFLDVLTMLDGKGNDFKLSDFDGGSVPVLYRIVRNTLTLYMLDEDKVKAAIAKGDIAGTVEKGDYGDVQLTADAKTLDAFFAKPEAVKLFKVFLVLKKTE